MSFTWLMVQPPWRHIAAGRRWTTRQGCNVGCYRLPNRMNTDGHSWNLIPCLALLVFAWLLLHAGKSGWPLVWPNVKQQASFGNLWPWERIYSSHNPPNPRLPKSGTYKKSVHVWYKICGYGKHCKFSVNCASSTVHCRATLILLQKSCAAAYTASK
jgi:hypothetical protein